jgi:hypothetical protein
MGEFMHGCLRLLLLVLVCMVAACSGSKGDTIVPGTATPFGYDLPDPVELRSASATTGGPVVLGSDFAQSLPHDRVRSAGDDLILTPLFPASNPQDMARVTYLLDMSSYAGDAPLRLAWSYVEWEYQQPGWIGLVDFAAEHWRFFPIALDGSVEVRNAQGQMDFSPYINANRTMPVLLLVQDIGLRRLAQIGVTRTAPAWINNIGGKYALLGYSGESLTVNYTLGGDAPTGYDWDFGGGASVDDPSSAHPLITLGEPGDYAGTVTLTSSGGVPYRKSFLVRVTEPVDCWAHTWSMNPGQGSATGLVVDTQDQVFVSLRQHWDTALLKYSSTGDLMWARGSTSHLGLLGELALDPEGALWSAGAALRSAPDELDNWNICLAKLSSEGAVEFAHSWDYFNYDFVHAVVTGPDCVYVVGDLSQDQPELGSERLWRILVLKLSLDGSLIWSRVFGTTSDCNAADALLDSHGHLVICGKFETGVYNYDALLLRINPSGTLLQATAFTTGQHSGALSVSQDSNGLIVTGYAYYAESRPDAAFVMHLDPSWSFDWARLWLGVRSFDDPYKYHGPVLSSVGWESCFDPTAGCTYVASAAAQTGACVLKLDSAGAFTARALTGQVLIEDFTEIGLLSDGRLALAGCAINSPLRWQPVDGETQPLSFSPVALNLDLQDVVPRTEPLALALHDIAGTIDEEFPPEHEDQNWRTLTSVIRF